MSVRYARHLLLPEVGEAGQERLLRSRVVVVGAGGLGCPVLQYLAAAGVGTLSIIDPDVVELSNLQRQILFDTDDVGSSKAEAAAARLGRLNPDVACEAHVVGLAAHNALELLQGADVVVDATDSFPARYALSDATEILGVPLVYGAIHRFSGQITVFNHQGGPSYRDLFPEPPDPDGTPSCAVAGVLGVLPGVIGTIQATEVLKLLLGRAETLSGRVVLYDALTMTFRELALARDPDRPPVTAVAETQRACGDPMDFQPIDAKTCKSRMDEGWKPFILDVRPVAETRIAKFPNTDRIHPHIDIAAIVDELPRDRDILLTCRMGGRSARAARTLAKHGFTRLFNLDGGIKAWAEQVDRRVPVY